MHPGQAHQASQRDQSWANLQALRPGIEAARRRGGHEDLPEVQPRLRQHGRALLRLRWAPEAGKPRGVEQNVTATPPRDVTSITPVPKMGI